jgi:hypothetical protein
MSKKLQDQATTTTTPTNWFVNIAGGVRQLTAAAFNSLIGSLLGTQTHAATAKTTLVDADELPLSDSAASNATKKITWANLWLAIKAKADLVYAAVAHNHSAADLTSGTLPDARFPSTLPALNGSALTNLNAGALTTGTIDVARIPLLYSGVQVVSSGAIADLTSPQQATVTGGAIVTTTDGRRWIYKGSGGKTTEASYIETADVTPEWSVIANKPSTFAPSAHATAHKSGGADAIKLDELAAPTDVTTLNATTSAHGLLPKLGGGTTNFLRADGSWAAPPGGGGGSSLVRGSGQLKGNTTPHGPTTPVSGYSINTVSSIGSGTLTVDVNGSVLIMTFDTTNPYDGSVFIDITSFSGSLDYALAIESQLSSYFSGSLINIVRTEFNVTFDTAGSGTGVYVNASTTMGNISTSGYVAGTDGYEGYGAVTEIEIIPAVSGKTILPVRVFALGDGAFSGMTVDVCLKEGGSYYPLCAEFSTVVAAGEILGASGNMPMGAYQVRWINGLFNGSLVARLIGTVTDGGTLTLYAICEQN